MRLFSAAILLAALSASAEPKVEGLEVKPVTKPGATKAVGALCVDSQGRIITNEVNRFGNAVTDDRKHFHWLPQDFLNDSVEERLKMYEQHEKDFPRALWTGKADTVRTLSDKDGDGFFEDSGVLGDFNDPLDGPGIGILERDGHYYYTCTPHLWKLTDANYDGKPEGRESLSYGWGIAVGFSGHDMHSPIWGPDGKIYFTIGDRGYKVKTKEGHTLFNRSRGALLRINPDGSGLEEVVTGLRNPQEIAFNDTFDLVTGDNNGDMGDKARAYYLVEGGDYGWTQGYQSLTSFGKHIFGDERLPPAWMAEQLFQTPHPEQPWWVVPASGIVTSGPSGLVYVSTDALGADTKGSFLVCDFVGNTASGVRRFKMVPKGAGYMMEGGDWWLKGCNSPDITLDHAENLLVGDFGNGWEASANGGVWKVIAKNPQTRGAELFKTGFRNLDLPTLVTELSSPILQVRVEAQAELVRRGSKAELLKVAQGAGSEGPALFGRLHALRGLGQLDAVTELRGFVKDAHAEIRTQALRALADAKSSVTGDFVASLEDAEIRVRQAAALGCARKPEFLRYGREIQIGQLAKRFNTDDARDPWMRATLSHTMSKLLTEKINNPDLLSLMPEMAKAALNSPEANRLFVVALRKARSPVLASFLKNSDPAVVAEAVAAISFENVEKALPALAEFSATPACWKLSELNQARALNANLRLNNKAGAERLLSVLGNKEAPQSTRRLAGYILRGFLKPWPMDIVEGQKLDWASGAAPVAEDAKELIASRLPAIIAKAEGEALVAALKLGEIGKITLDEATLRQIALNAKAPEGARVQALSSLGDKVSVDELAALSKDASSGIRVAAMKTLTAVKPEAALPALLAGRSAKNLDERQTAWSGLGALSAPEAIAALKEGLAAVDAGKDAEVALDIYLAAKKQAGLKTEVTTLETKLNADPMGPGVWILAAKGGDVTRGEKVFRNPPPACECLKCHKVGPEGASDAGPNLKNFLGRIKEGREEYALRATVATSADLAPKFGFVLLTLKDGKQLSGTYLGETDKAIKVALPEGEQQIAKDSIASRQNISAMPPLKSLLDAGMMKPEELRDLNAYLLKVGTDNKKKGH
ncbi:MAG: hypothetical protein RL095_2526 [Verrucomicrobiota bacterium]|jgi:quinoprotein glucose dehydrogenase